MVHEGNLLKQLIKENKYTQTQIAEKIGMNRSQFNILLNKAQAKEELIKRVCEVLHIQPEQFFESKLSKENAVSLKKENQKLKREIKELTQFKIESLQKQNHLFEQIDKFRERVEQLSEDKINLLLEINGLLKKLDIYKQIQNLE